MNLAHFLRQAARRFGDEIGLVWGDWVVNSRPNGPWAGR